MTTTCVVRHQGAVDWMKMQSIPIDYWTESLDLDMVESGDTVIGILPMHMAAEVCAKGATFIALMIDLPREYRGKELTVKQLEEMSCCLMPFHVEARKNLPILKNRTNI